MHANLFTQLCVREFNEDTQQIKELCANHNKRKLLKYKRKKKIDIQYFIQSKERLSNSYQKSSKEKKGYQFLEKVK